ncbi:MAG: hypothetical protein JWQ14_2855 [Adhaeribacter sp.]|jgi:hypothetical protein|nr:hypothetical protein [Adhaeribacter sp.]
MQAEKDNQPSPNVVEEGEKVTGGEAASGQDPQETSPAAAPASDTESAPDQETKKEDMTGYNEHPDQEKVGGG